MESKNQLFELRTYYPAKGKREALINRFRYHTFSIFDKHGMVPEAFWLPVDSSDQKLIYLLSFPDKNAFKKSWDAMLNDPAWLTVKEQTNKDGDLVDSLESVLLKRTSFSPVNITNVSNRLFELRTYKITKGNQEVVLGSFENHLISLFEKHGITNVFYGIPDDGEHKQTDTLTCLLAHQATENSGNAFKNAAANDTWQKIEKDTIMLSEDSLIEVIESVYLHAADFSPLQ